MAAGVRRPRRGVDLILHGGDIHDLVVLDQLAELAPVYSARGNGEDGSGGRAVAPAPSPAALLVAARAAPACGVGLTHDLPVPEYPPRLTVERWKQRRFATDDVDVIVYGDSHVELIEVVGATLCVNPGSPTYPHNLNTQLGTLGFLEIDGRPGPGVHLAADRRRRRSDPPPGPDRGDPRADPSETP